MAHSIQRYVDLGENKPWSEDGVPLETFRQNETYKIRTIRSSTAPDTIVTKKELSQYRAFYIISANMDKWEKHEETHKWLELRYANPIKIGVTSNPLQRIRSYIASYGEHNENTPTKGAQLHMLLVTKTPNEVVSSYQQSAVKQLEKHLIDHYQMWLAHNRGKERFTVSLKDVCDYVVQTIGNKNGWWKEPTKTIKRIRRSNTISEYVSPTSTHTTNAHTTTNHTPLPFERITGVQRTISRHRTLPLTHAANVGDCYIVRMYPRKSTDRKWNVVKLLYKRPDQTWGVQWMNTNYVFQQQQQKNTRSKLKSKRSEVTPTIERTIDQKFFPSWVPLEGGDEVFRPRPPHGYVATYYELPTRRLISDAFQLTSEYYLPQSIKKFILNTFRPRYH